MYQLYFKVGPERVVGQQKMNSGIFVGFLISFYFICFLCVLLVVCLCILVSIFMYFF